MHVAPGDQTSCTLLRLLAHFILQHILCTETHSQLRSKTSWSLHWTTLFQQCVAVFAAAVAGGVANVWKLNQIFPAPTSSTASEDEKKRGQGPCMHTIHLCAMICSINRGTVTATHCL